MAVADQLRRVVANRAVQVFTIAETQMLGDLDTGVPVKTGQLKRSRTSTARYSPTSASVTVEYPPESRPGASGRVDVARYTDEGTSPHVIVARRARALRFVKGGRVIFAKKVNHPGTKGTRWWTKRTRASDWHDYLTRASR